MDRPITIYIDKGLIEEKGGILEKKKDTTYKIEREFLSKYTTEQFVEKIIICHLRQEKVLKG